MEFKYLNKKDNRGLINDLFTLRFFKEDLPFKTIIIPVGYPTLVFIFSEQQETVFNKQKTSLSGLTVTGQFYGAYNYTVNDVSCNIGMTLHPTALYKILNINISTLTNKHILLEKINKQLSDLLKPTFINNKENADSYKEAIIKLINNLPLHIDTDVENIDKAVDFIIKKEGLLSVSDLLKVIPLSQKSLETKFKKIIGLTPGKYIKLIRFTLLMRKYETKQINITDLIYMFDYYDYSHFSREFKLFMSQSPKSYFKKDFPFLKKYILD